MDGIIPDTGEAVTVAEAAERLTAPPRYWRRAGFIIEGEPGPEYEAAFLAAQTEIGPLIKAESKNTFTDSKYANLPHVLANTMPVLNRCGLTLKQGCGRITSLELDHSKRVLVLPIWTQACHAASGQWERVYIDMPLVKLDAHGFASATTYGRRISLQAFWGLAATDDDGVLASLHPRLDNEQADEALAAYTAQVTECDTIEKLRAWQERNKAGLALLDEAAITKLREHYSARLQVLKDEPVAKSQTKAKPSKTQ